MKRLWRVALAWWRSLTMRLAVAVAVLVIIYVFLLNTSFLLTLASPDGIVSAGTFGMMERALSRNAQGDVVLSVTPEITAAQVANPTIRLAVIDQEARHAIPGSDLRIHRVIAAVAAAGLNPANFDAVVLDGEFGHLLLLSYADRWTWSDVQHGLGRLLHDTLKWIGPVSLAVAVATASVVAMAVRPLRRAGLLAETLSLRTLHGRVPTRGMATEILPFVRCINTTLDRLDQDVTRQSRFIADAAHELRTPFSVLRARLDGVADPALKRELLADADRISSMMEQMLTIAKLGDVSMPLDEIINLPATVSSLVADYAPVAIERGRHISFEVLLPGAAVLGNRQALSSAVLNVIDNAVRAEPDGGCVTVRVGPGRQIVVTDHGPGVADEDLPRLFEPFWRKDHGVPGSGLGLQIVRECMRLHRGTVVVTSQPGQGAEFCLDFEPNEIAQSVAYPVVKPP